MADKVIDAIVTGIRAGRVARQDSVEIAYAFIQEAGGMRELGALIWQEFRKAPPGSPVRQRMLMGVLDVLKKADDRIDSSADLTGLSDEELAKQATLLLGKVLHGKEKEAG